MPDSIVYSDCWKGYNVLDVSDFHHFRINHSQLFADAQTLPLTPDTHHLVNAETIPLLKPGALIVNTGRGALIDAKALVDGIKSGQIGGAALDVYEDEAGLFYSDRSSDVLQDDTFSRLLTFPNVVVTSHMAYFTDHALNDIAHTALEAFSEFEHGKPLSTRVEGKPAT